MYLLKQLCHSLAEAHARGMVHRDIKPANIFLCRMGLEFDFVKVLDFGLVQTRRADASTAITETLATAQQLIGTPAYMAPEVILGRDDVDRRADVYAIGCVAFYLLTGTRVFNDGNQMQVLVDHVHTEPVSPSTRLGRALPRELDALVLTCLRKQPEGPARRCGRDPGDSLAPCPAAGRGRTITRGRGGRRGFRPGDAVRRGRRLTTADNQAGPFRCLKPRVNAEIVHERSAPCRDVCSCSSLHVRCRPKPRPSAQTQSPLRSGEPDVPEKAGKELAAHYVGDTPPRIDGDIGDEIWQLAQVIDDMTQNDPNNMQPPTERTLIKVAYDDRSVYVGGDVLHARPAAHHHRAGPPRHLSAQRFDQDHLRSAARSPDRLHL